MQRLNYMYSSTDRPGDLNGVRRPNGQQEQKDREQLIAEHKRELVPIEADIVASIAVHQYMRRRREPVACRSPRRIRLRHRARSARRCRSATSSSDPPGEPEPADGGHNSEVQR